ncbi:hypothetical protein KUTeg_007907 [Tegillarca granosa]|uniref:Uncharacterized protein n=1 Tax=Tegillarca granosa TaxID=220873 RepID=A0ABQ9FEL2_TEGGR|nr:hypothetical protein KUTeg_007907 [Tegillarca granosa]
MQHIQNIEWSMEQKLFTSKENEMSKNTSHPAEEKMFLAFEVPKVPIQYGSTVEAPAVDGIETSIADNPGVTEADDEQIYDADALWFDEEMAHQDCDSDADDDTEEEMDEDVSPETWENLSEEDLNEDLGLPVQTRSGIKNVNDLLFWFLFFILYWQSIFHLSDCGIELLLKFLFQFFNVLHLKIDHFLLAEFSVVFPTSVYMLRKLLKLDRDNFERYVVCQECFSVYDFFNCFTEVNGIRKTKLCNHETVVRGRSKTCDTPLLKEVVLKGGVVKLYPYKIYCFNSLINRIEQILQKNNIPDIMCYWKDWQGTPQYRNGNCAQRGCIISTRIK